MISHTLNTAVDQICTSEQTPPKPQQPQPDRLVLYYSASEVWKTELM